MADNSLFTVDKEYDPVYGRYVRAIKAVDIVHISAKFAQYSAGSIAMTTMDANRQLIITGFGCSSTLVGGASYYLTIGTSTVLPTTLAAAGNMNITVARDAPLAIATANSTISLWTLDAGTQSAWFCGVREPIITKVETE